MFFFLILNPRKRPKFNMLNRKTTFHSKPYPKFFVAWSNSVTISYSLLAAPTQSCHGSTLKIVNVQSIATACSSKSSPTPIRRSKRSPKPSQRLLSSVDTSQNANTPRVQSNTQEVNKTFVYPIADEVTVERLEAAVRKDKEAWNKYVWLFLIL